MGVFDVMMLVGGGAGEVWITTGELFAAGGGKGDATCTTEPETILVFWGAVTVTMVGGTTVVLGARVTVTGGGV